MAVKKLPNIIFVMADQLRYQSVGYTGDSKAITPHIDAFAKESLNLNQAVVSHPVCAPTRASLFTGKYTTSTGMVINELRMNPNHTCLGHCLTNAGYKTAYIGKWHLYANQLGNHYDPKNSFVPRGPDRLGFDGFWASYNFHHLYWNSYFHTETKDKLPYADEEYNKEVYEPDAQTDIAIAFLEQVSGIEQKLDKNKRYLNKHFYTSAAEPFALFLSVGTPHDPWKIRNVPKEYYTLFKDIPFPPAPNYSDEIDPYGDAWSNIKKSPKMVEKWMRIYYAMTTNLDWNFGRLLKKIKELGLYENTIVIFTSDHGECFGAHGRMKKNTFYEEACRIPFLIRWPGKIKSGSTELIFNSVDFFPTLLGLIGMEEQIPKEVEGVDLSPFIFDQNKKGSPEFALLMNTGACADWENGHEWRALRTEQYTYAIYRKDKKELLFDNISDPYQLTNLINEPDYGVLLSGFRMKLRKIMEEFNDFFLKSTDYRDHWIEDRIIKRTATME